MTDRASAGIEASAVFNSAAEVLQQQGSSLSSGGLPPDLNVTSASNADCISYASVNTEEGASFSIGWAIEAANLAEALSREIDMLLSIKADIVLKEVSELQGESEYYLDMKAKIKGMI